METKFTDLRKLRIINEIGIDDAALEIRISGGYLSKLERGLIQDIKNPNLKTRVIKYINKLKLKEKKRIYKITREIVES